MTTIDSLMQDSDDINEDLRGIDSTVNLSTLEDMPPHWKPAMLGEISHKKMESLNPQDFPKEIFEYYSIPAFQEQSAPILVEGKHILSNKLLVQKQTILFGKLNPRVLKVWLVGSESENRKIASTEFIPLLPNGEALPEFVYYLCQSKFVVPIAKKLVSGSTPSRQRVDVRSFYKIQVFLPPLPEQGTIAHVLQIVQQAIQARSKELELERERKSMLMQHLFTHSTRNEPTKQREIGEIPESWDLVELNQVVEIVYGVQAAVAHLIDESLGIPIFTNVNIRNDGRLDLTTLRYYDLPLSKQTKLLLKKGDLLFNWRSGSQDHVGKTALFNLDGEYTFSSFILRLRPNEGINNLFLLYYLHHIKSLGYFARQKQQSSVNSVFNASIAAKIPVVMASRQEQQDIATILQACDAKITAFEKEITLYEELFRALLDELMTGRISTLPLIEQPEKGTSIHGQRTPDSTGTTD